MRKEFDRKLVLEDGAEYYGYGFGDGSDAVTEIVFNTSMVGYQEILTDPSYAGQGVVMTYPLIGNYGVNEEDDESFRPWAEALIVRHLAARGSNFRCQGSLDDYLKTHNITGIENVDTRAITRILRKQGTMNGMITTNADFDLAQVLPKLKAYTTGKVVEKVTCQQKYTVPGDGFHVALMDFGTKKNIVKSLNKLGCQVTVYPALTTAEEILAMNPDGIMLSNGPGNPEDNPEIIEEIRKITKAGKPMFGICLGHQLLAIAKGAKTGKMKFGHRGANQPVKDLTTGRVYISSQNHGYEVLRDTLPEGAEETFINVNDGTCEGITYHDMPAFTVQFHPEACAGPKDTEELFGRFIQMMRDYKEKEGASCR